MTSPLLPVERQVKRVRRRLFTQTLLDCLAWCWVGALTLTAVWFLLQPLVLSDLEEWVRWAVLGGAIAVGTLLALELARRLVPSRTEAALALDHRFNLRERVTTSLSLTPAEQHSPAACALLADVTRRIAGLDVPARFPLQLSWPVALIPACAGVLALIAFLYEPGSSAGQGTAQVREKTTNSKEIEAAEDKLKKALATLPKDLAKSEKLKELEKDLEKLMKQPLDPNDKQQVRERLQALQPFEEKMKDRLAGLKAKKDKAQQIKDALKNLETAKAEGQPKDGPGKDLKDALAKGQMDKAADEVERLRKKLEDPKLGEKERQQLEKDLQDLENRLKRLADLQDLKDQLQKALEKGELAREEFDQRMQELADAAGDLQDLQDLAEALGECLNCLKKGDKLGAGKALKLLRGKLVKFDPDDNDLKACEANEAMLLELRLAMCRGLNGNCEGNLQGNGMGGDGPPGGRRPMGKDGPVDRKAGWQPVPEDEKGERYVSGFRRGGTFSRIPAREVGGAFRQAQQDAPAAIDRQRVPPDAAEILRGYYENLSGQKNK